MKYIAHYIPVEGEINDWVKDTITGGVINISKLGPYGLSALKKAKHYIPVELSLCTREFVTGDKVFHNNGFGYVTVESGADNYGIHRLSAEDKSNIASHFGNLIKVIGPISIEALEYVKEYDEFLEEQIRVMEWINDDNSTTIEVLVKGPCKHFH